MELNKYRVAYKRKALSVTLQGKEYHQAEIEFVHATTAVSARKKAKRTGWTITGVWRVKANPSK